MYDRPAEKSGQEDSGKISHMSIKIRQYQPTDYEQVAALYKQSELFGGQYDNNRDSEEKLRTRVEADPDAIFVAQLNDNIVGTVSLIEDGRVAWLFRFAVAQIPEEGNIAKQLYEHASKTLQTKGHNQVLVYAPAGNKSFETRYTQLGFTTGGDYTCYWKNLTN